MIRRLTEAERDLWERVRRSVRPLRRRRRREAADLSPAGDGELTADAADAGTAAATGRRPSKAAWAKPAAAPARAPMAARPAPIEHKLRRRLARGTASVDARLDLHGMTQEAAISALESFLRARQAAGDRMVLVITGKGRAESAESGVLRRQVPHWLSLPRFRDLVAGYGEAGRRHGGGGALYIRLRRSCGRR